LNITPRKKGAGMNCPTLVAVGYDVRSARIGMVDHDVGIAKAN